MWAYGAFLYYMLVGSAPFCPTLPLSERLELMATNEGRKISPVIMERVGKPALDLIAACLQPDPVHRPSIPVILSMTWLRSPTPTSSEK